MVTKLPRWAPDPETYAARKPARDDSFRSVADRDDQMRDTGVWWTEVDTSPITLGDIEGAWHRFRARLPELVWHAARLSGSELSLPEVRALLSGVSLDGHAARDEPQVLALAEAYGTLRDLVGYGRFHVDKSISDRLNRILARHETPGAGRFRGEGTLRRDGSELLRARFATLCDRLAETDDPRLRALIYFCSAVRTQFYAGANGPTALLMMTGILLSSGFDAVTVPHERRLELDHGVDTLLTTDDATELMGFLVDCAASGTVPSPERAARGSDPGRGERKFVRR